MTHDSKPRWVYRFDNYKRAFLLLREAIERSHESTLNQLEKEGIIQRFEYTWELAWKSLKDYLDYQGLSTEATPRAVIRTAFAAGIITNGELWMQALDARNKMTDTYSFKVFETVINEIKSDYLNLFDQLYIMLLENIVNNDAAS